MIGARALRYRPPMQALGARLAPFSIVGASSVPRCVPQGQRPTSDVTSNLPLVRPIVLTPLSKRRSAAWAATADLDCVHPARVTTQAPDVCVATCEYGPDGDQAGGLCPFDSREVYACGLACPAWCGDACEDETATICPGLVVDSVAARRIEAN